MSDRISREGGKPEGFSLMETAVLLVVLGVAALLVVPAMLTGIKREKMTAAKSSLAVVRDGILGYAQLNHCLPGNLTQAGQSFDPYGAPYVYRPDASLLIPDLCDLNSSLITDFTLDSNGSVLAVAFLLAGTGFDHTPGTDYSAAVVDFNDIGDDLAEYVTYAQLKALVCSGARRPEPPAGYVGRFAMDEGGGDVLVNSGGLGGEAEIMGDAQWVKAGPDYALELKDEAYVTVGGASAYDLAVFTIMGWFMTNSSNWGVIVSKEAEFSGIPEEQNRNWWVGIWDVAYAAANPELTQMDDENATLVGGELVFRTSSGQCYVLMPLSPCEHGVNLGTNGTAGVNQDGNLADGYWHFFAVQQNASAARLYVDGVLYARQGDPGIPDMLGNQIFYIGKSGDASNNYFNGLLKDIIVYDTMVDENEIISYYDKMKYSYGWPP